MYFHRPDLLEMLLLALAALLDIQRLRSVASFMPNLIERLSGFEESGADSAPLQIIVLGSIGDMYISYLHSTKENFNNFRNKIFYFYCVCQLNFKKTKEIDPQLKN